jgi:hypothetical protein
LIRKVVSSIQYPHNSEKTNAQKSEISTKIDVYSYRRALIVVVGQSLGVVG